ncbi:Uncharacterized protein GBIM_06150, partial [Gryllus bimaculatus]
AREARDGVPWRSRTRRPGSAPPGPCPSGSALAGVCAGEGRRGDGRHCDLCGSSAPSVRCDKCASQNFCLSCDDMYHRHPKRQSHVRKALDAMRCNSFRPPLPPKGETAPAPVPPPRRNKRPGSRAGSPLPPRPDQGPTLPKKEFSLKDKMGSLKRLMGTRPLPPTPGGSSRFQTLRDEGGERRSPGPGPAPGDRLGTLQLRYRQHQAAMRGHAAPAIPLTVLEMNARSADLPSSRDSGYPEWEPGDAWETRSQRHRSSSMSGSSGVEAGGGRRSELSGFATARRRPSDYRPPSPSHAGFFARPGLSSSAQSMAHLNCPGCHHGMMWMQQQQQQPQPGPWDFGGGLTAALHQQPQQSTWAPTYAGPAAALRRAAAGLGAANGVGPVAAARRPASTGRRKKEETRSSTKIAQSSHLFGLSHRERAPPAPAPRPGARRARKAPAAPRDRVRDRRATAPPPPSARTRTTWTSGRDGYFFPTGRDGRRGHGGGEDDRSARWGAAGEGRRSRRRSEEEPRRRPPPVPTHPGSASTATFVNRAGTRVMPPVCCPHAHGLRPPAPRRAAAGSAQGQAAAQAAAAGWPRKARSTAGSAAGARAAPPPRRARARARADQGESAVSGSGRGRRPPKRQHDPPRGRLTRATGSDAADEDAASSPSSTSSCASRDAATARAARTRKPRRPTPRTRARAQRTRTPKKKRMKVKKKEDSQKGTIGDLATRNIATTGSTITKNTTASDSQSQVSHVVHVPAAPAASAAAQPVAVRPRPAHHRGVHRRRAVPARRDLHPRTPPPPQSADAQRVEVPCPRVFRLATKTADGQSAPLARACPPPSRLPGPACRAPAPHREASGVHGHLPAPAEHLLRK